MKTISLLFFVSYSLMVQANLIDAEVTVTNPSFTSDATTKSLFISPVQSGVIVASGYPQQVIVNAHSQQLPSKTDAEAGANVAMNNVKAPPTKDTPSKATEILAQCGKLISEAGHSMDGITSNVNNFAQVLDTFSEFMSRLSEFIKMPSPPQVDISKVMGDCSNLMNGLGKSVSEPAKVVKSQVDQCAKTIAEFGKSAGKGPETPTLKDLLKIASEIIDRCSESVKGIPAQVNPGEMYRSLGFYMITLNADMQKTCKGVDVREMESRVFDVVFALAACMKPATQTDKFSYLLNTCANQIEKLDVPNPELGTNAIPNFSPNRLTEKIIELMKTTPSGSVNPPIVLEKCTDYMRQVCTTVSKQNVPQNCAEMMKNYGNIIKEAGNFMPEAYQYVSIRQMLLFVAGVTRGVGYCAASSKKAVDTTRLVDSCANMVEKMSNTVSVPPGPVNPQAIIRDCADKIKAIPPGSVDPTTLAKQCDGMIRDAGHSVNRMYAAVDVRQLIQDMGVFVTEASESIKGVCGTMESTNMCYNVLDVMQGVTSYCTGQFQGIPNAVPVPQLRPNVGPVSQLNPNVGSVSQLSPDVVPVPQLNPNVGSVSQLSPDVVPVPQLNPNVGSVSQLSPNGVQVSNLSPIGVPAFNTDPARLINIAQNPIDRAGSAAQIQPVNYAYDAQNKVNVGVKN